MKYKQQATHLMRYDISEVLVFHAGYIEEDNNRLVKVSNLVEGLNTRRTIALAIFVPACI